MFTVFWFNKQNEFDKSDIIFTKQKKSGMSKDNTEYSKILKGLDILCVY